MSLIIQNNKLMIEDSKPTLVFFYSPHCPFCINVFDIIQQFKNSDINLFAINVETDIALKRCIKSVPTILGFVNKKFELKLISEITKQNIIDMWKELISIAHEQNNNNSINPSKSIENMYPPKLEQTNQIPKKEDLKIQEEGQITFQKNSNYSVLNFWN